MWDALATGIVTHYVVVLFGLAAAAAIGYLKVRGIGVADTVFQAVGAFCLVIVAAVALKVNNALPALQTASTALHELTDTVPVTTDSIEPLVRQWADAFNWSSGKLSETDAFFSYQLTTRNGQPVVVKRTKDRPEYLLISAALVFDEPKLKSLATDTAWELARTLQIELLSLGIEYAEVRPPLQTIHFGRLVRISQALSEDRFLEEVQRVLNARLLAATIASRFASNLK
jgi:hypothetical protein